MSRVVDLGMSRVISEISGDLACSLTPRASSAYRQIPRSFAEGSLRCLASSGQSQAISGPLWKSRAIQGVSGPLRLDEGGRRAAVLRRHLAERLGHVRVVAAVRGVHPKVATGGAAPGRVGEGSEGRATRRGDPEARQKL